jgi:hypothetical protein
MTAAEDLHRRQETETALGRLMTGRQYTRKGLFSRVERWHESLLRRLTNGGMVETTTQGRGKPTLYRVKDELALQSLLDTEDLLLQMVFPSYKPAPAINDIAPMLPGIDNGATLHPVAPEPVAAVSVESLQQALESSDVMSTEILLKLLLGMIELLNSQTDQLNGLTAKVDALDDKVARLLKELTE